MIATKYPHIVLKDSGEPMIDDTRISVLRIVKDVTRRGYRAEDIPAHYPILTLGQVYGALSYYHDNQEEVHRLLEEDQRQREWLDEQLAESQAQVIAELRAKGFDV